MPETLKPINQTRLFDHFAVRAWRQIEPTAIPERIEILQEWRDNAKAKIYRLPGVGPGGTAIVAKRCPVGRGRVERLIYETILPNLPVSALRCYGFIKDQDDGFCWLFLEDAGDEDYCSDFEEHRLLAGRWLGTMNVSAQNVPMVRSLPDRGPSYYAEMLRAAREYILRVLERNCVFGDGALLLKAIVSHCDTVEERWNQIETVCHRMPRTVVHGDFAEQNARIRGCQEGRSLLLMDWEGAGWGIPAADLSKTECSLSPDIAAYWTAVRSSWPNVTLADVRRWSHVGRMFRLISALGWLNSGFRRGGLKWYVEEMKCYEPRFAGWLCAAEAWAE